MITGLAILRLAVLIAGAAPEPVALTTRPLAGARADVVALILTGGDSGALGVAARARSAAEGLDFEVEVAGADLSESFRLELHAYVLTSAGEVTASQSRWAPVTAEAAASGARLGGRFDVAPDDYQLRVLVRDPGSQRFALRVLAVPAQGPWVLSASAAPERLHQTLELEEERRAARRVAALAGVYRGVLGRLASGALDDAVDALRRLEEEALDAHETRGRAQGWLAAAQEQVIRQLADADPESLLPLLVLHLDVHARYLEDGVRDPYLLNATRDRVLTLARGYVRGADSELAPSLAASALAGMGVALDRAGLPGAGRRMLEEALALDDANVAVLLDLAYWHERHNAYGESASLLRRLLAADPGSAEGRLRLAHSLARLDGAGAEAEDRLRQVVREGSADWILAVAYQELGRLLVARVRFDEAVDALAQGIARLPAEQSLRVQLAYARERAGQRATLGLLPSASGGLSPRQRYSRRPRPDAAPARALLLRHATARLPLLASALSGRR